MRRRSVLLAVVALAGACGDDGAGTPSQTTQAVVPLVAEFEYEVGVENAGDFCVPSSVDFFDRSTGAPTGWRWEFDDGEVLTEQNPHRDTVSYGEKVMLTITRGDDSASVTKELDGPVC